MDAYWQKALSYPVHLYILSLFSSVTNVSRGKFPVLNIHGYVKKIRRSAHDIKRGKLEGCFDARGARANYPYNELRDISFHLGNLYNV